jgi:CheY-like chemotaxis protein
MSEPLDKTSSDASPTNASEQKRSVLVVDDEVPIGKALQRILSREHDVLFESDARSALERLQHETFDVVFCDLMMPHMSGMDFYAALAARDPELAARVVFLTGGAFSPRSEEFLRGSRNTCITKPFSRDSVTSIVRLMISGEQPEADT